MDFEEKLRAQLKPVLESLNEEKKTIERTIHGLAAPFLKVNYDDEIFLDDYVLDFRWGCEDSPYGWCTYNDEDDPAHDTCIFCGLPQERK